MRTEDTDGKDDGGGLGSDVYLLAPRDLDDDSGLG